MEKVLTLLTVPNNTRPAVASVFHLRNKLRQFATAVKTYPHPHQNSPTLRKFTIQAAAPKSSPLFDIYEPTSAHRRNHKFSVWKNRYNVMADHPDQKDHG
jgi:hypothetical protein